MKKRILPNNVIQRKLCVLFLAIMCTATVSAQRVALTGEILDEQGVPVVGAFVVDRNDASTGAVSAADGSFSMQVDPSATLVVSMTGYVSQEIVPGNRTFISVRLADDTQVIGDIVVIGYGTLKRRDLTGAVASVGRNVLSDQPVNSLGQALQGRAPGVYVVDNGNPQQNVTLKIRGLGTINDSDPLYVIDGVPTSLGLNAVNPADIETIDILKDASATAIYGSQGANGVVIITTRRGRSGDGVLNVNVNLGISQPTNIPVFLNAAQYAALNNDILRAGGETPNPAWADPSSLGKGTDWIGLMFGNAFRQDYSVNWSGGDAKNNFYVSGGYTDHEGIVNSVSYRRITFQINGEQKLKPWLRLGENITLSYEDKRNGSYDLSLVFNSLPTQPVYDADGNFDGPSDNTLWYGGTKNQYAASVIDKNQTEHYNLLGSVFAEFSILDGLKFKSLAGVETQFAYISNLTPKYPYKPIEVPNTSYYRGTQRNISYLWDNYFTYNKTFGDHSLSAMGGMSLQWGANDWFNGSKYGFLRSDIHQLDNGKTIASLNGSANQWAIASFMFRAN